MKINLILSFSLLVLLVFSACDGSDTYRGKWKATDSEGAHYEIFFKENSFTVKPDSGKIKTFGYTQNSINIENSKTTYGIQLDDGRNYQIIFPFDDDDTKGIINDGNSQLLYTISRNKYITYEDIYKLK